jgi:two-component system chemotaxis response regulator CheB
MIVDESAVFRKFLSDIINNSKKNLVVIGTAPTGKICLTKMGVPAFKPDIVLIDIAMPEMYGIDGVETISNIMDLFPTPVIVVTKMDKKEASKLISNKSMSALETGFVEFVKKPDIRNPVTTRAFKRDLLAKISSLSPINLQKVVQGFDVKSFMREKPSRPVSRSRVSMIASVPHRQKLMVIGASTGGTRAISLILSKFPLKFPPVVIIQHIPGMMVEQWVERLINLYKSLKISIATNGESLVPNRIYVAPGGRHLVIQQGKTIQLVKGEKVNFVIPSVDVTLSSAAEVYKQHLLGIILTGMGKDGTDGAKQVKKTGGKIFVEHKSTCMVYSMPKYVIDAKLADRVVPLHDIPGALLTSGWI